TRRFLLLQAISFMPMFRGRAGVGDDGARIDQLEPSPTGADAMAEIFADVSADKRAAARKTYGWLQSGGNVRRFIDEAQRMIYLKGTDSHDYKFSSAVLEDYHHISPGLRDRFLAACVFWLKGSGSPDNGLVARTRELL
ncbi:MAG TPA: hypothetical protein DCY13_19290, partial [Verrucomicrobiales bacterium]|nr:hypothetical protein [Verrucomicrobiales bacterium]